MPLVVNKPNGATLMARTPGAIAETSPERDERRLPRGLPATRIGLLSRHLSSTDAGGFHPTSLQLPFVDQSGHSVRTPTTAMVVSCTTEPPLSATRESRLCLRASTSHRRPSTCLGPNWILPCCICTTRDGSAAQCGLRPTLANLTLAKPTLAKQI